MARESIEKREDPGSLDKWIPVGLIVLLWAVHAISTYLWLSANQFAVGWDRPKHLVSTLIFDRMLRPLNIVTLFEVFSLNIGYYPPLFPLSVVPLYRTFGVSADVAGMVNVVYMLILLLSLYGIGRRLYNTQVGLFGAFLGAMSPFLFSMAHYTYIDYALTAMITLAVYLLLCTDGFRRPVYSVLFGVAVGLGMLYKWTPALFVSGPLLLVLVRMVRTDLIGANRRSARIFWPWREFIVAVLAGLVLTWLWYTPNADLAATLLLGNWLPLLSVVLIGATVFFLLLPGHPIINVLKSLSVAALLTSLWYLPRADMFRDIVSIVAGGRADRPNYLDLSAYVYYPSRLIQEGLGWPLSMLLTVLLIAALCRFLTRIFRTSRIPQTLEIHRDTTVTQHLLNKRKQLDVSGLANSPDVFILLWFLLPFIVATFSTHREVRSVLPLMSPIVVAAARLILDIRNVTLRRMVVGAVSLFLIVQFVVLNLSALAPAAQATEIAAPLLGRVSLFARGEHIQWANKGGHDGRYWIAPDVLHTMTADFQDPAYAGIEQDAIVLGLLINSRAVNEYNIDYLIRTEYPDVAIKNLSSNRDLYPGYARIFGCDYLLMRDEPDSGEPADLVRTIINDPPAFFSDNFSPVKTYSWPDGETIYLFKNETHRLPDHFGAEWLSPVEQATEIDLGDELRLLGYNVDTGEVAEVGKLLITLYWMNLRLTDEDYSMRLKLLNGVRHVWGEQEGRPRWDASLTSKWTKAQVIEDIREIPVQPGTPPGSYTVEILVEGLRAGNLLEPANGGELLLGPVQLPAGPVPSVQDLDMDQALEADFRSLEDLTGSGQIRLLGYKAESGFRPGDGVHLTLYWQARSDVDQNYEVFNHLVGQNGEVYGQKDNPPVDGYYPTSLWTAGEIVRDRYDLTIPTDAPPQEYMIVTGLYLPETGQRLAVTDQKGRAIGDEVTLHRFEISEE